MSASEIASVDGGTEAEGLILSAYLQLELEAREAAVLGFVVAWERRRRRGRRAHRHFFGHGVYVSRESQMWLRL